MEFLDISSPEVVYQYVVKIEKKFQQKNKQEIGLANSSQKQGKGNLISQHKGQSKENQHQENQS